MGWDESLRVDLVSRPRVPNEICQPEGSESFDAHTIFYLTLVGMGGKANSLSG